MNKADELLNLCIIRLDKNLDKETIRILESLKSENREKLYSNYYYGGIDDEVMDKAIDKMILDDVLEEK